MEDNNISINDANILQYKKYQKEFAKEKIELIDNNTVLKIEPYANNNVNEYDEQQQEKHDMYTIGISLHYTDKIWDIIKNLQEIYKNTISIVELSVPIKNDAIQEDKYTKNIKNVRYTVDDIEDIPHNRTQQDTANCSLQQVTQLSSYTLRAWIPWEIVYAIENTNASLRTWGYRQQYEYCEQALYMDVNILFFPVPYGLVNKILIDSNGIDVIEYANAINSILLKYSNITIVITQPLFGINDTTTIDSWDVYTKIQILCNYSSKQSVALYQRDEDLSYLKQLPPISSVTTVQSNTKDDNNNNNIKYINSTDYISSFPVFTPRLDVPNLAPNIKISRWLGESIHSIIQDINLLYKYSNTNITFIPILKEQIYQLSEYTTTFIWSSGITYLGYPEKSIDISIYEIIPSTKKILQRFDINTPRLTPAEVFIYTFRDVIEIPLQPLRDNQSSQIYQVFEKDPIKYIKYTLAINSALVDLQIGSSNSNNTMVQTYTIFVLGAGRGPLVDCALYAAKQQNINIIIYALDKNPYALHTLYFRKKNDWNNNNIHIINCDMRDFAINIHPDIIVSELLGSFSDNELAPECILNSLPMLCKDTKNTIVIPTRSISFISPVTCSTVWSQLSTSLQCYSEAPLVVYLHRAYLASMPQVCFDFLLNSTVESSTYISLNDNFIIPQSQLLCNISNYANVLLSDLYNSLKPNFPQSIIGPCKKPTQDHFLRYKKIEFTVRQVFFHPVLYYFIFNLLIYYIVIFFFFFTFI